MEGARFFNSDSIGGSAALDPGPRTRPLDPDSPGLQDDAFEPDPAVDNFLMQGEYGPPESAVDPAKVASFQAKADARPLAAVEPRDAQAVDGVRRSGQAMQDALKAGVDVARSTFLRKVVGAIASVIALGVMVAATVATGGAAAPALAVACLSTLSYAGDAACAFREWKNAQALQAGDKLPYEPLPCGASAVGNLAFAAVRSRCHDDESAKAIAHKVEIAFSVGLLAFSLATCMVPPELKLAEEAVKLASLGLKSMMYMQATLSSAFGDGAAEGSSQARGLDEALERLDQALGSDDAQRGKRLEQMLDDPATDLETRALIEQVMGADRTYDAARAATLRESLERAGAGGSEENPALLVLATCVNLASLALVERAIVAPHHE